MAELNDGCYCYFTAAMLVPICMGTNIKSLFVDNSLAFFYFTYIF